MRVGRFENRGSCHLSGNSMCYTCLTGSLLCILHPQSSGQAVGECSNERTIFEEGFAYEVILLDCRSVRLLMELVAWTVDGGCPYKGR